MASTQIHYIIFSIFFKSEGFYNNLKQQQQKREWSARLNATVESGHRSNAWI